MESNPTCAERIDGAMSSRQNDLEEIYEKLSSDNEEISSEGYEEIISLALEVSSYRVIKILLSTGGPADWIEVTVDDDNEILSMKYVYQDWFDYADKPVRKGSYLWQYASELIGWTDYIQIIKN